MALSEQQKTNMKYKRKKILEEAIILFSEKGFAGTTVQKVAEAAEVSFGSVFTYFENKEKLFHAAIVEPLQEYSLQLLDFDPEAENLLLEIERMVAKHIHVFSGVSKYLNLVVFVIGQNDLHKETFKELNDFQDKFRNKLIQIIENGQEQGLLHIQDPKYAATSYTSLLLGLRLNLIDKPESAMWQEFIPYAMQLFGPKRS